jgi:hypothetical protein
MYFWSLPGWGKGCFAVAIKKLMNKGSLFFPLGLSLPGHYLHVSTEQINGFKADARSANEMGNHSGIQEDVGCHGGVCQRHRR